MDGDQDEAASPPGGELMSTIVEPGVGRSGHGLGRRALDALDERLGLDSLRYEVPEHANNFGWSLGGITGFTFIVLVATGLILVQYYNPTPEAANQSVRDIMQRAPLGAFVRGIHFWAAQAMYVLASLHLLRVFVTGSYKRPREANWLIGVAMYGMVVGALFSGTVLKWDQEGFEALVHNLAIAKVLGGVGLWFSADFASSVPILVRLYGAHVVILPGAIFVLMVMHFLLIKKLKISSDPKNPTEGGEPRGPFTHHLERVAALGLLVLGVLGILAILFPAGVGPLPVEGIEVTKPPWMFYWMFGLENFLGVNGILYGAIALFGVLVAIPFVDRGPKRYWRRRPIAMAGLVITLGIIVYLSYVSLTTGMSSHLGG
jgi:ubiquinol-cytochrome c reductase cytochrome b subunit